jgi:hypothetical protein
MSPRAEYDPDRAVGIVIDDDGTVRRIRCYAVDLDEAGQVRHTALDTPAALAAFLFGDLLGGQGGEGRPDRSGPD